MIVYNRPNGVTINRPSLAAGLEDFFSPAPAHRHARIIDGLKVDERESSPFDVVLGTGELQSLDKGGIYVRVGSIFHAYANKTQNGTLTVVFASMSNMGRVVFEVGPQAAALGLTTLELTDGQTTVPTLPLNIRGIYAASAPQCGEETAACKLVIPSTGKTETPAAGGKMKLAAKEL